jgi:hypothetical protein
LRYRELALLWLKTSQTRGGYAEYWQSAEFQTWASENGRGWLLYHLVFEVNDTVMPTVHRLSAVASWAGLFGVSILTSSGEPLEGLERTKRGDLLRLWRTKLCDLLSEVLVVGQAAELISESYVDGHNVLFADTQRALESAYEKAELLIVGYNCFVAEGGEVPIDMDAVERLPKGAVEQFLNEWVILARSKALAARGKVLEARDEVMAWLNSTAATK